MAISHIIHIFISSYTGRKSDCVREIEHSPYRVTLRASFVNGKLYNVQIREKGSMSNSWTGPKNTIDPNS